MALRSLPVSFLALLGMMVVGHASAQEPRQGSTQVETVSPVVLDAAEYDRMKAAGEVIPFNTTIRENTYAPPPPTRVITGTGRPKGGGSNFCNLWQDPDPCPVAFAPHDDLPSLYVNLPFTFNLYGQTYTGLWINNNGNVTFDQEYGTFNADPFPNNTFVMVAPFWGDVDTGDPGNALGEVSYCVSSHRLVVTWDNVGYYNTHGDKRNTFQLILTDGTDPILGVGNNVAFNYQDMQWTTGDASGGAGGFGGTPAVVGANLGDGSSYIQIGTFDHAGTDYDGPLGNDDGVSWLDYRSFVFSTEVPNANIPPLVTGNILCDTITLCVGETTTLDVTFFSPEPNQTTIPIAQAPTLSNWTLLNATSGPSADISVEFTPTIADVGYHTAIFQGIDNGSPSLTTTVPVQIHVLPVSQIDTVDLAVCSVGPPVDLFTIFNGTALPGGTWRDPNGDPHSGILQPGTDPDGPYQYVEPFLSDCPSTGAVVVSTNVLTNTIDSVEALCFGSNDGTMTVTTTGNGGPWNYTWSDGSGNIVQTTSGQASDTYTGGNGSYTVIVQEGPNGAGCSDTLTSAITEPAPLIWSAVPQDTLICLTGNAILSAIAEGGTGAIQLHWDQGLAGNGPHVVSPSTTTVYSVQAEDANGCLSTTVTAEVEVHEPLSFTPLEPDTECVGIPVVFTATGAAGGDGEYFYDWGAGPLPIDSASFLLPNTGTVCVTLTDGCETPPVTSCVSLEILHTPPLVLTADTTFGCAPFSVRLNLQDTTQQASVLWDFGFGVPEQDSTEVVHLYPYGGNFAVGVEVTWPNGCITDTSIANMIHVLTVPIADLTWSPNPATILEPTVHFQDLSQPNVVGWQWDFGELGTSSAQDTSITFPNLVGDSYPVQLVVMNELGCTDTIRTVVDVLDDFLVFVPNAFTPNAEGPNETFFISGNDISTEEYQLIVFDRWGKEMFNSTDRFEAWDGTSGGDLLPQGVYVWKLKVRSLSSAQKRTLFGHVTLLH